MNWNHRIVQINTDHLDDDDPVFMIAEVHYDDDGKPIGFTEPFVHGDSIDKLRRTVAWFAAALDKPVLHENDMVASDEDES